MIFRFRLFRGKTNDKIKKKKQKKTRQKSMNLKDPSG